MLPGVGGFELVVIAIVALVVVGPKDLPLLMRKIGGFMNRLRGMAAEFRASFDEMARQSELDDLRKEVEALRQGQMQPIADEIAAPMSDIEADLRAHTTPGWTNDYTAPAEEPDRFPAEPEARPKKPRVKAAAKPKLDPEAPAARTAKARSKTPAKPAAKRAPRSKAST